MDWEGLPAPVFNTEGMFSVVFMIAPSDNVEIREKSWEKLNEKYWNWYLTSKYKFTLKTIKF